MNYYLHSENIGKITVLPEDYDPAELNYLEQLGLYLIGNISRGKLAELWNCDGYLDGDEVVAAVWEAVKKFVKSKHNLPGLFLEGCACFDTPCIVTNNQV